MKFLIKDKPLPRPKDELVFDLILRQGGLELVTVDDSGKPKWFILSISAEGKLTRYPGVPFHSGLVLDQNGIIQE